MTKEEKLASEQVQSSIKYDGERYEVQVPWLRSRPLLENNNEMAFKSLQNTEKRLLRQGSIREDYGNIIKAYEKRIRQKIDAAVASYPESRIWYLPHFPICRPDRSTTKTKIVFDASAECNGQSLNKDILPGPKLQNDLLKVHLRFRHYPIALV